MAGSPFAQQPEVRIEDQYGNVRSADSSTVLTASRSAGSGTLQGTTNLTAASGVVSFTNLSHNVATNITIGFSSSGLSGVTSGSIAVSAGSASRLTIQTQPSAAATAGVAFGQQPVVRIEDGFGNLVSSDNSTAVTASRSAGSGTLQGATTQTAVNGLATFTNLSHTVATNITIQFAGGSLAGATSTTVVVSAGAASNLAIQTQPSAAATAGVAFATQPQIRIVDQFGNLRSGDNTSVVSASRNLGASALQGTVTATASGGVASFANLSYNVAETMNLSFTSAVFSALTASNAVISPAAASKLTILTQPSSTATAGVPFAQQPQVRIEDQFGNLRNGDNTTVVSASRNAGSGVLQGTTNVTAVAGIVGFGNLSYPLVETMTVLFTGGSLSNAVSSPVAVSAAPFARLQLLSPGETAAPGTANGKTGTPIAQTAGSAFSVTANAVDANWNLVTNVSDLIGITASDANAVLPPSMALVSGTKTFSVTLYTSAARTLTSSDLSDGGKTA